MRRRLSCCAAPWRDELQIPLRLQEAARRFGFVGNVWASGVLPLDGSVEPTLRQLLTQMPRNVRFNRYGVAADESARAVAFYFASMELNLEEFPRAIAQGGEIHTRLDACARRAVLPP